MTLCTRGLGSSNNICLFGLGSYGAYVITDGGRDTGSGGSVPQYQIAPRKIFLKIDDQEPSLRLSDITPEQIRETLSEATEVTLDGETYEVSGLPMPTPKQALEMLPPDDLIKKIEAVKRELGVSEKKAVVALKLRAKKELSAAKLIKEKLVEHDEALALIIIFSEV